MSDVNEDFITHFDAAVDEFERRELLAPDFGIVMTIRPDGMLFHSTRADSQGRAVGAQFLVGQTCPSCDQPFSNGETLTADLLPKVGGRFQHLDCDDTQAVIEDEQL